MGIYGISGVYLRSLSDTAGTTYISLMQCSSRYSHFVYIHRAIAILTNSSVSTFTTRLLLHLGNGSSNHRQSPVACLQCSVPERPSTHIPSCLTPPADLKQLHAPEDKGTRKDPQYSSRDLLPPRCLLTCPPHLQCKSLPHIEGIAGYPPPLMQACGGETLWVALKAARGSQSEPTNPICGLSRVKSIETSASQ